LRNKEENEEKRENENEKGRRGESIGYKCAPSPQN
jgi:hypothetical protein